MKKYLLGGIIVSFILFLTTKTKAAPRILKPGEFDFRPQKKLPLGIKNNNPGNIIIAANRLKNPWKGQSLQNTDGRFEQFILFHWGVRAMMKLINNKMKGGLNTIDKLIRNWSATGQETYVSIVEKELGINRFSVVPYRNKKIFFKLVMIMIIVENGRSVIASIGDKLILDQMEKAFLILINE